MGKLIMMLILSIGILKTSSKPSVINGKLINEHQEQCRFKINDTILYSNETNINGIYYGLIEYKCNDEIGFLLSKPKCIDCGIYCPQNDMIMECNHFIFPFLLGIFVNTSIIITIYILYHKLFKPLLIKNIMIFKANRLIKKNKKINKIAIKIKDMEKDPSYVEMIEHIIPSAPSHINDTNVNDITKDNTLKVNNESTNTIRRYPSLTSVAIGTLALTSFPDGVFSCDRTLFFENNGLICDSTHCQNFESYQFSINSLSTICFETPSDGKMIFKIEKFSINTVFDSVYYTSDFNIKTMSTYNCKGAGLCDRNSCKINSRHPNFPEISNPHRYGCDTEGLGCEQLCFHKYACTFYSLEVVPEGNLYKIYKKENTYWQLDLSVEFKGSIKRYIFNTYTPSNDLNFGTLFGNNNLPISIISTQYASDFKENFLISTNNTFFNIKANELNYPTPYMIGDLQISLDLKNIIYPVEDIRCQSFGCSINCISAVSQISRFFNDKNKVEDKNVLKFNDYQLLSKKYLDATVQMSVGNIDFKNLYVEPATCNLEIIETFGCVGCNQMPYIVLQATQIKTMGSLQFSSNCTFYQKNIPCRYDPFILNPKERYNYCYINIARLNKTLYINLEYKFKGNLDQYNYMLNDDMSALELTTSILGNQTFLDTITYGLVTFTGISLIITILSRLITRILIGLSIKKEIK